MYKHLTRVCQLVIDAEDIGFRFGVELAYCNPPIRGEIRRFWKERIWALPKSNEALSISDQCLNSSILKYELWQLFESAMEDGMQFVSNDCGYFSTFPNLKLESNPIALAN